MHNDPWHPLCQWVPGLHLKQIPPPPFMPEPLAWFTAQEAKG